MNREQLITWVKSVIYPNGNNEIDAQKHQDLEIGVINTLMDSVASMANGYLGTIQANAPAPTPQKNGYYIFSTGGTIPYISGTPIVKVGDWLSVTYVGLNYTYTNVDKLLNLSDDYTVSNSNVGASLKAIYDGLAKLKNDLRGDSLLTIEQLEERNINTNERIDNVSKNIFDIGRGRLSGGTYAKADARLLVLQSGRSRNYQLSYCMLDGTSITENFTGASFIDTEWIKDSNWQTFVTSDVISSLKGSSTKSLSDIETDYNTKIKAVARRSVDFVTDAATTRKQIVLSDRMRNFELSYSNKTEQYIGSTFTDTEWVKDSNWTTFETQNNKNVANGYAGLDAAKKLANDVIRTDFRMSQGYIFDGIDDYLTIPHNDKLNFGTDDFSIQVICKVSPSANTERLLYKLDSNSGFGIRKAPSNEIILFLRPLGGAGVDVYSNKVISREEILNILYIIKSGTIYLYINGVLDKIQSVTISATVNTTDRLTIGTVGFDNLSYLNGTVSLVRLFNRALSQKDVTYYENNGRPDLQRLKYEDVITNYGELVVNGNFDTNYGWVLGGGWTINNGKLVGSNTLTEAYGGEIYLLGLLRKRVRLSFISNVTSGNIERISLLGDTSFSSIDTTGTYVSEFINKGTYPDNIYILGKNFTGSIDNVSVKQLGCVLELLPENALPNQWLESQNSLNAITSGNPAVNTEQPVTNYSIVDNVTNNIEVGTANRDYTLPAGYIVDSVCVNSTVALTALQLVNVTNSETLLTGKTVSATANKHLPITADQSSSKVDSTIRLNCAGNTGLGFNIVINIKKCL